MAANASRPPLRPIKKLLIANRGEIAIRVLSSARELGLETYTLTTEDDASHTQNSTHVLPLPDASSYLNIPLLIDLIKKHNIDAIHPGYGFLSESAEFAERAWKEAGAVVVGPGWSTLARTGDKLAARQLAEECRVPVLPALQTPTKDVQDLKRFADKVGFPIIIKAVDGGGGRGIRIVRQADELDNLAERALRESPQGLVFAEKAAIDGYRHVEVQIIGDGHGNVRHLWERECSIQRRFQKVVEFAPSSIKDRRVVAQVIESALRMAKKVDYLSLGTFEFLVHQSKPEFYFLEVNPRLQVEHTITENICGGVDLVASQLAISQGAKLSDLISHIPTDPASPPKLHSIQLRVTAEDAAANWSLSVGRVSSFSLPTGNGIRNETNLVTGLVVKTDFDSLLAKVIAIAPSWPAVVAKAVRALQDTRIDGVKTSLPALRGIIASPDFLDNRCDTRWLESQLDSILSVGQRLTAELPAPVSAPTGSYGSAVAAASSNVLFRKGDAWSIDLLPAGAKPGTTAPAPAHLAITKVLRNEFPQSLSAEVAYTAPGAQAVNYTASIRSTTASASSLASGAKHRRGEANNPGHVIIPFPGQLVEILVDVGDVIKKGDVVAVVKQMKMELEIRASRGGTVTWVSEELEEGMDVGEGVLVAEVDVREEAKL